MADGRMAAGAGAAAALAGSRPGSGLGFLVIFHSFRFFRFNGSSSLTFKKTFLTVSSR